MSQTDGFKRALIVGASRGLGSGLVGELASRGCEVVATVRSPDHEALDALRRDHPGSIELASLDLARQETIRMLRDRLAGRAFDLVFVNGGIGWGPEDTISTVTDEDFSRIMLVNALGPIRVLEAFAARVAADGVLGVMTSRLGSVALCDSGTWESYRASKAALNILLKSLHARLPTPAPTAVAMAPGWVRTDMGGDDAPLDVANSVRGIVDTLERSRGKSGVFYRDYTGAEVPW